MFRPGITTIVLGAALLVLATGCAAQKADIASPSLSGSTAGASTTSSGLSGTWRGWFAIVGGEADRRGDLTLEVKDDGTYTLTWARKGTTSVESGVVAVDRGRVALRSSAGHVTTLARRGDALYGTSMYVGAHPIYLAVRRPVPASDAAGSALPGLGSPAEDSRSTPVPSPLQAP